MMLSYGQIPFGPLACCDMAAKKTRLDQIIVDRGLAESKTRAQALVMAGKVFSGERKLEKPGTQLSEDTELEVRGQPHPWVSRG